MEPSTFQFRLTPEQSVFCAHVRDLARTELLPLVEAGQPGRVNRPLLRAMGQNSLLARLFPDASSGHGGAAALDLCLLRESLAQVSTEAETALALQGLGTYPVLQSGSPRQIAEWLPRVVAGEAVAAFALSEPRGGPGAASPVLAPGPARGGGRGGGAASRGENLSSHTPGGALFNVVSRA